MTSLNKTVSEASAKEFKKMSIKDFSISKSFDRLEISDAYVVIEYAVQDFFKKGVV